VFTEHEHLFESFVTELLHMKMEKVGQGKIEFATIGLSACLMSDSLLGSCSTRRGGYDANTSD
jgi:hypothetical protein